jgi:tetratricopeptide (TPR) repeat protein
MVLCSGSAAQGAPKAAELDQQARAAFEAGDFALAARRFRQAYEAAPHPATRYNEAWAWEQAGERARAADAYEQALAEEGLDADRTAAAKERLMELDRTLGVLSIRQPVGGTASVAHVQDAKIPFRVHVTPGSHEVRILEPGHPPVVRNVDAQAGKEVEILIEVTPAQPKVEPNATPSPAPPKANAEPSGSSTTWGWVAIGGAGALSLGAGYLGLRTLDSLQEYEDSGYRDADAQDQTKQYRLWTNVAWGAAAVSATVGVVLLLSGDADGQESSAHLRVGPGEVLVGGTF